jgi:hypothetical protein
VQPEVQAVPHAAAASQDAVERPSAESHGEAEARRAGPLQEAGEHAAVLREAVAALPDGVVVRHVEEQPLAALLLAVVPSFLRVRFRQGAPPAQAGSARIARATAVSSTA